MSEYKDELIRLLRRKIEQYEKEKMQDRKEKARDKKKIKKYEKRIKRHEKRIRKDRKEKARGRKERMQYRKKIREYERKSRQDDRRHEKDQERIGQLEQRLDTERRMWPATWDDDRRTIDRAAFMHRLEVLEDIICGGSLQSTTSMDRRQFDYISDRFTKLAKKHTEGPLFSEDEDDGPGNRCKLSYRHTLLMSLMRKYGNPTQGAACGVLWHRPEYGMQVPQVLRHDISQDTAHAGHHVSEDTKRPHDQGGQEDRPGSDHNGRRHAHRHTAPLGQGAKKGGRTRARRTLRVTPTGDCRQQGTGDICESAPGSVHDLTMIKNNPPDLGTLTARMRSNRYLEDEKVKLFSDLGYVGIKRLYPGVISMQPHKKPRGGKLTKKQKAQNRRISSKRVTVEHAIGRIKQYKWMRDPYDGTAEEFDREFQVTAGLANFRLLWDKRNKKLMRGF